MSRLSWLSRGLIVAGLVLALPAQATLMGRLEMTPGLMDYQAYYDDDLDVTWAADADINGFDTWANQLAWVAGLTIEGVSGWRLPTALNQDGTGPCTGFTCTGSEMGHLFYVEGITAAAPGPFSNVQASVYWSGTEFAPNTVSAWGFKFDNGNQVAGNKVNDVFAWAVHSGDVSATPAIPEPSTMLLMGTGLVGLMGWQWLRRGRSLGDSSD